MKKYLLPLTLLPLLVLSCGKDLSLDTGDTPLLTADLLTKVVYYFGTDSSQIEYSYDASKRLIGQRYSGTLQEPSELRFVRDGSGIIIKMIRKDPALVMGGIDSLVTVLNYDITASRYASRVSRIVSSGVVFTDSVQLFYNPSGKLIREEGFIASVVLGNVPVPRAKTEYTWSLAGNLTQINYSEADIATGGPMQQLYTFKYTHDAGKSALQLTTRDAYGIGLVDLANPNNVLKENFEDISTPTDNYTFDYSYVYNAKNKPATGVILDPSSGSTTNVKYVYKTQ